MKRYFKDYKINPIENSKDSLIIYSYISEDDEEIIAAETQSQFYLREGKTFFINIFVKNNSHNFFENFHIEVINLDENISIIEENEHQEIDEEILPLSDYLITYLCSINNAWTYENINLPQIIISYNEGNINHTLPLSLPKFSLIKYNIHPFMGKHYLEFIYNIFNKSIIKCKTGLSQFILLSSRSGYGKSRLIQEMKFPLLKDNFRYLIYNCYDYNNMNIFRKLICDLLYIPYNEKNLFYTKEQLNTMFLSNKMTNIAADTLSSFICNNSYLDTDIEYISQYLSMLIEHVSQKKKIFIGIDNIQNNSQCFFKILKELILYIENKNLNIIVTISLNIEKLIEENINNIKKFTTFFKHKIDENINQYIEFKPAGFQNEKINFWMNSLNRNNPSDSLILKLSQSFGDIPLEVITISDYFKTNSILKCTSKGEWYISDKKEFYKTFDEGTISFEDIFSIRFNSIFKLYPNYEEAINQTISTIVLFNNNILYYNCLEIVNDYNVIDILRDFKIIKLTSNILSFYHDSIYNYFQKNILYSTLMINTVYNYVINNDVIENKDSILFNVFFQTGNVDKYSIYGLKLMQKYISQLDYLSAIQLGKLLFKDKKCKEKHRAKYLLLGRLFGFSCSSNGNKDESCEIFLELCPLFNEAQNILESKDICDFYRDAVNSLLQSSRFDEALDIIKYYENVQNISQEHKFLSKNREGVIYLSLNKMDKALEVFNESLILAHNIENNTFFWTSTVYSDIALLYFYSIPCIENKVKTIENFKKAISDYNQCEDNTIYRYCEILWHNAFVCILEQDYESALTYIDSGLKEKNQQESIYSIYRFKNLQALCYLYKGEIDLAIDCLRLEKSECETKEFITGLIKIYNNLGVAFYISGNPLQAFHYLELSFSFLSKDRVYLKMFPVLSNLLIISKILDKPTDQIIKIIQKTQDVEFIKHCMKLMKNNNDIEYSWTLWNFKGLDYIY